MTPTSQLPMVEPTLQTSLRSRSEPDTQTEVCAAIPPSGNDGSAGSRLAQEQWPQTLYILLDAEGAVKMGTCRHCVVEEAGRPERAWEAKGDRELDFARDQLLSELAALGVELTRRQAYVCP